MKVFKKKDTHKDILFILASSFIVVVAWVSFNIYHVYITSTISQEVQAQLQPIDGTFDRATLEQLKKREKIDPLFNKQTKPTTPTPSISQPLDEDASSSSRLTPTKQPTNDPLP